MTNLESLNDPGRRDSMKRPQGLELGDGSRIIAKSVLYLMISR